MYMLNSPVVDGLVVFWAGPFQLLANSIRPEIRKYISLLYNRKSLISIPIHSVIISNSKFALNPESSIPFMLLKQFEVNS